MAGGGVVRQQRVLLVVAVNGAGGDDVVLVLIHQGQFGVVVHCSQQGGGQAQVKGSDSLEETLKAFRAATKRRCHTAAI